MHPHKHHDVIEQVLCGELPADDPRFVRALESDPALREHWERLQALTSTLDAMGATERTARRGPAPAMPAEEERVAQLVRRHFQPRAKGALRRGWLWGTLLAASLAVTLWTLRGPGSGSDETAESPRLESIVLGEGDAVVSEMRAVDLGDRSYRLEWRDTEESFGRTYFVRIHERDGGSIGTTLEALGSEELLIPRWTFSVPAGLDPDRLAWSVEVRDADRNPVATSAVLALPSR